MEALRILVVDDERGMRMGVERALRDFTVTWPEMDDQVCFTVDGAGDGQEALAAIATRLPDVLLLDYKLPDISGLDILDRVSEKPLDLITVMITAYASLDTAVQATKRGAYDFLAKPFTPEELRGTVRKAAKHLLLQRHARRLAEEKRQIRFQFVSMLAHEMKSPLAAVEGYLRIIRERSAGDDPAVYARMLDRSLVRLEGMHKLIGDLLDLTSIESGQRRRQLQDVDLAGLTRVVLENFTHMAAERGIALHVDSPATVALSADPADLEMILNNLVSNAIKYNAANGRVNVTLTAADGRVRIAVADTGIGMAADETQRLFSDFVRIKNPKTRDILGSGLGLSIVRKLAVLYGGDVSVTSSPGVGSTFTVELAAAAAA